jgi:hypothetical protein
MGLAAKPQTAAAALQSGKATIKIGRPGYRVTKARDPDNSQRTLAFEVDYPEAEEGVQPRHRFMSAYEQRVEAPDKNYQYLLVACEPYETVTLKQFGPPRVEDRYTDLVLNCDYTCVRVSRAPRKRPCTPPPPKFPCCACPYFLARIFCGCGQVAFKIPSDPLDKGEGKFTTAWDESAKKFTVQLAFATAAELEASRRLMASAAGAPKRTIRALATGVLA